MVTSHYGVLVNSETPTTGVINTNRVIQFIIDEIDENGIDLDFEEHCKDCHKEDHDLCYISLSPTYLIGDWRKDDDGRYIVDKSGKNGYAAICAEIYTQVVWSKYIRYGDLCSPCFPGQVNLESDDGDYAVYDLPPEAYEEY